jgi:GAF domain-containing protein
MIRRKVGPDEVREMSATPDSMLGKPEQPIADLQRQLAEHEAELAECKAERDEALEQQTAIAEVLQVINSSPGDLAPVFDAILEKAHTLCGAAHGALATCDGEYFRAVALHAMPEAFGELLRQPFRTSAAGSAQRRLLQGERLIHIPDVQAVDPVTPIQHAAIEAGIRTLLVVPLRKDDRLLGYITANRREVRPFSDKQIVLLQNFAAQAVLAMENARLLTETREALEQQTATAEVLQVINSSPGDLAPVFDAVVEKAMRLCEATNGYLFTYDGDRFHAAAIHGDPRLVEWHRQLGPFRPAANTGLERIRGGERLVHIPDVMEVDVFRTVSEPRQAAEISGFRSALTVALRRDEVLVGALGVYRREVRPFSDKQISLLQNFAAQAVIAMENARLLTETREALEQQTATAEVLQVINSSPGNLMPVFDAMLDKAMSLCEAVYGELTTYDGERFHTAALRGVPFEYAEYKMHDPPNYGVGSAPMRLLAGERVVHITDLTESDLYRQGDPNRRALVDLGSARSLLTVPLLKDSTVLGSIMIYRHEVRPFTDQQIALLQNFAAQAVIAMESARLIGELRERTSDLEESLEYQTATSDVLQVISRSTFDLQPVLDTLVETAVRLCTADTAYVATRQGEVYRPVAAYPASPEWNAFLKELSLTPGRGTLTGRTALEARVVHIRDMADDPEYALRETVTIAKLHTGLGVPLLREGEPIGVIALGRHRVEPFTERQIELVRTFADQAVIAIENARLITETREALEQQTATAEVLQVINSSPGDLAPVFDAIVDKAVRLCGAAHGFLRTYDGECFHLAAARGESRFFEAAQRQGPIWPRPGDTFDAIVRGEPLIHIGDVRETDFYREDSATRERIDLGGIRTWLTVALRKEDTLFGTINIYRQEVKPFSEKEIALLQNFAAQAVIAMENARLITETREALDKQTATAEVLQVINSSPGDLVPVFKAILEKALRICGAAAGNLLSYDGEFFHVEAAVHADGRIADNQLDRPPLVARSDRHNLLHPLLEGKDFAFSEDVRENSGYRQDPAFREMVDSGGYRSLANVALRKEGALLGSIGIYRQEVRRFTDKQIALLQNFAEQAVIAMENARLLGELRQRTDEVADLNRGLAARVAEQVEELGRVGRLKRFLAPQLAELIVSQGDEKILESHRREIVVVFCDLRGYTAFTETAEPEEVLEFLREYHGALGPLVAQFEGTLDQFSGDGIMVFFNDPVPCPDPSARAVKMAMAMREEAGKLIVTWRERGRELGFGAGIAQGYATLGQIGFADRSGYTAIGTVCNVAARLCAEAKDGQILISQRVNAALGGDIAAEQVGALALKGLSQPVMAFNVPVASIANVVTIRPERVPERMPKDRPR